MEDVTKICEMPASKRLKRGAMRIVHILLIATWVVVGAAGSVNAQVPQSFTYRGRAVDSAGDPLNAPITLELRVFDAEFGGTELYAESHGTVVLGPAGYFSVQLGAGQQLYGKFDWRRDCDAGDHGRSACRRRSDRWTATFQQS